MIIASLAAPVVASIAGYFHSRGQVTFAENAKCEIKFIDNGAKKFWQYRIFVPQKNYGSLASGKLDESAQHIQAYKKLIADEIEYMNSTNRPSAIAGSRGTLSEYKMSITMLRKKVLPWVNKNTKLIETVLSSGEKYKRTHELVYNYIERAPFNTGRFALWLAAGAGGGLAIDWARGQFSK